MLRLLMGRANTGKTDWILREIADKGDSSRQILMVPEHASYQAEVDLCRSCGGTASRHAEVLSFRRLADRVLSITGGLADVTLDAGGKLLSLQKALLEVSSALTVYRQPSRKAAFLEDLLALFDEFQTYDLTPECLSEQAADISGGQGEKLRDLALLYGAYSARLHRPGFDARDKIVRCIDAAEDSQYLAGKDIYLDGFTYFNGQEYRILSVMLRQAKSVTVSLMADADCRDGIFESAARTRDSLLRLARENGCPAKIIPLTKNRPTPLGHLERCFFDSTEIWAGAVDSIHLWSARTTFSEAERTAAEIRRLIRDGKCRYREIVVTARNMPEYESVIENVFERYGIPTYLSRRSDILETPAMALLTGVLASITGGYEYEDMFRWLKTGLAGLTPLECDCLENYVMTWEIHGRMWIREEDWTANPDGYGVEMNETRAAALEEINALRRRVRAPLSRLAAGLKSGETIREKTDALYSFMEELSLRESLEMSMKEEAAQGRLQQAEETAQLWEILCGVLDQFVEILGEERLDNETFYRLFRTVATQYSIGTIPAALDHVSVCEFTRNDRHAVKYVFLLGANDNVLPATGQRGGILNEDDRNRLAQQGIELAPSGLRQMNLELQSLYAALSQPTEGLWISFPSIDLSGAELRPAFVFQRLQTLFPNVAMETEKAVKDYRLTALLPALEMAGENPDGALWRYFAAQPEFSKQMESMTRGRTMSRGRLSRPAVRTLYGDRFYMSASRLEKMNSCHFAYFMQFGLKAKPRQTAEFDAIQIGTFLHYLLENVIRDCMAKGGYDQMEKPEIHALVRYYIEQYIQQEMDNFQEKGARFRYLFTRLRTTAYAVVEEAIEELRHSDFIPLAFELTFGGKDGTVPAVSISSPEGSLMISGKVDRVDGWVKDGKLYLRVVDYKTGRKSFDLSAVRLGLDLQMLLYLFTLQKEGGTLFPQGEIEPAGVLYFPARNEILSAERSITPEELRSEVAKSLRRSGLLLQEPEVLKAMEHEALDHPQYLPLRIDRNGGITGAIASAAQLGKLAQYLDKLLHRISREMHQGNIDADPYCHSDEDRYCQYCDFAGACHFQDGKDGDHLRYIIKLQPNEFWQEISDELKEEPS